MVHAVRGFDILWKNLPTSHVLYNDTDISEAAIKKQTALARSGLCPCLLANIGSAMTIVGVSLDYYYLVPRGAVFNDNGFQSVCMSSVHSMDL